METKTQNKKGMSEQGARNMECFIKEWYKREKGIDVTIKITLRSEEEKNA